MSLKILNKGLCDAGSEDTSRIAMSDIFTRLYELSAAIVLQRNGTAHATGLTQDQHTNSGRRLPFVLLPSFYGQEII